MTKTDRPGRLKQPLIRRGAAIFMIVFMTAYLITGIMAVPDYGLSADDAAQRRHSLINYLYVNRVLLNRKLPAFDRVEKLETYKRYYGVAIQLPMMLYEDLHHFRLQPREIYLFRHYCVFGICFAGYIFFYLALRKVFPRSDLIPVLGTLMICLYPRFYGGQFTDIKNSVFSALCMITFFFMVMAVETRKAGWQAGFGCAAAVAVNCRMMGIVFPVLLFAYWLCADVTDAVLRRKDPARMIHPGESAGKRIRKYLLTGACFFLFWYAITPKAWTENPLHTFVATFDQFSDFDTWDGTMVFMGKLIRSDRLPWYYQYVWIAMTVPILFLILFVTGHITRTKQLCEKNRWLSVLREQKWFVCAAALFWGSTLAVILLQSRIYVGWHHVYFVFVPMVVLMCFGLQDLMKKPRLKAPVAAILAVNLLLLGVWNGEHHLWQTAYFNSIGSQFAEQFDRGETAPATLSLCRWILDHEDGDFTVYWPKPSRDMLTAEDAARVRTVTNRRQADYIITNYRNAVGNDKTVAGFEEVYSIWMNRYKVGSVYKRIAK